MKICLATLHANPDFTPLALLYLKASVVDRLRHRADDVAIVEGAAAEADAEAFAAHILSTSPRIVGLSCYVWNVETLLAAARRDQGASPGNHDRPRRPGGRADRRATCCARIRPSTSS